MSCEENEARTAMRGFEARTAKWAGGWRRWAFPGIWLIYLAQTVGGVHKHSSGAAAAAGYVIVGLFACCYLGSIGSGWAQRMTRFWWLYGAMFALTGIEAVFARQDAFVFFVYISVLTVAGLRQYSAPVIGTMMVLTLVAPKIFPGWTGDYDYSDALAIALVGLAMYGFFAIVQSNIDLAAARAEVARLAAENERSRIARDLHDLLGHSLTTITVKAGLARRLAERGNHERSAEEIAEVESLSRRTLSDVRAAVAGHREVTLAGELATAREVLRASGVIAELPASVDVVDPELSELFGWVLREAITNVVRHSHATHCTVLLGPRSIAVLDDGRGGVAGAGNGLVGLRERVAATGGIVSAGPARPGWRVQVDVPVVVDGPDDGPDGAVGGPVAGAARPAVPTATDTADAVQ
jgi:two-component system sensor histidine kinase DesK